MSVGFSALRVNDQRDKNRRHYSSLLHHYQQRPPGTPLTLHSVLRIEDRTHKDMNLPLSCNHMGTLPPSGHPQSSQPKRNKLAAEPTKDQQNRSSPGPQILAPNSGCATLRRCTAGYTSKDSTPKDLARRVACSSRAAMRALHSIKEPLLRPPVLNVLIPFLLPPSPDGRRRRMHHFTAVSFGEMSPLFLYSGGAGVDSPRRLILREKWHCWCPEPITGWIVQEHVVLDPSFRCANAKILGVSSRCHHG